MNNPHASGAALPDWNGSVAGARLLQPQLAGRVVLRDGFARPLRRVAGFRVERAQDGESLRASATLLDADTLERLATPEVQCVPALPAIAGLRSFRLLPALLQVLALLPEAPDLVFVKGSGIAHPARLGIAAHFGVATGLPCIGVATRLRIGTAASLHEVRGAYTPLRDQGTQVGWLLRSRPGSPPLVVSPGHRVAMASTAELVMRFVTTHRLPEPLHAAT